MEQQVYYRESGPYGCHLIRPVTSENRIVQYQIQLMTRSRPDWAVPCFLRYQSGQQHICHDLNGLKPLDCFYEASELNSENGIMLLRKILRILLAAEDLLMPLNQISYHPSNIYCTRESEAHVSIRLVFWPINFQSAEKDELATLIDSIASTFKMAKLASALKTEYQEGGVQHLASFIESKYHDEKLTDVTGPEKSCSAKKSLQVSHGFLDKVKQYKDVFIDRVNRILQDISRWLQFQAHEDQPPDNHTVLLPADPANFRMALIAAGKPGTPVENEGLRAYILVDEFLIGRDIKSCDLCLNEPGIGRQHARIIRRAGSFYLCDLGSRNGTRQDGRRLLKNVESLLPDQCTLQFADQTYYFQAD